MVSARRGWGTQKADPGALQRNVFVRPCSGEPAPSGPPLGPLMRSVQPPVRTGDQAPREPAGPAAQRRCSSAPRGSRAQWATAGARAEQCTWGSRTRKHREAGCGRPEDGVVWTAKTVKQPTQRPTQPQYANYWAPPTHKWHILPHPAQPQHTNHWAPRTRKRHQQEHRPQQPTESSNVRREERVTVQGPVNEQQPDRMSHRGYLWVV